MDYFRRSSPLRFRFTGRLVRAPELAMVNENRFRAQMNLIAVRSVLP